MSKVLEFPTGKNRLERRKLRHWADSGPEHRRLVHFTGKIVLIAMAFVSIVAIATFFGHAS